MRFLFRDYGQDGDGDDDFDDDNNEDDIQVREAYRVFDKERVGHITAAELRSTFLLVRSGLVN